MERTLNKLEIKRGVNTVKSIRHDDNACPKDNPRKEIYLISKTGHPWNISWGTESWRYCKYLRTIDNNVFIAFLFALNTVDMRFNMNQWIIKTYNKKKK